VRITALSRKPRSRSYELHLDGQTALTVSADVCVQFGLHTGDEMPAEKLAAIQDAESRHAAMAAALRFLSYRPRCEREVRDRLGQKTVAPEIVEVTIARLRETGLLNDSVFARTFVEGRNHASPRSRRLIAAELRAKGVSRSTAAEHSAAIDEADAAYRAATRRARSLTKASYPEFRRRVGDFLVRRGFDYELAGDTVSRVWSEAGGGPAEPLD
jgi:regulatory protein